MGSEGLKSKVMDVIDSLIPKGQNSLDMRTSDMVYGINKAKEAVLKLFNAESTQNSVVATQDGISRQSVLDAIDEIESEVADGDGFQYEKWRQYFCDLPSADVPDRNVGKWLEREVIHAKEAKAIITEWQSCKCSVCGCYDTRPYLYCFNEPRFCSWCGAEMKGEDE